VATHGSGCGTGDGGGVGDGRDDARRLLKAERGGTR
jgi:hypothetical protein